VPETPRSTPKISVVIPVYNYAEFLPRALESVLSQQDANLEVVVVDDGSIDTTSNVAQDWVGKYPNSIRYLHQDNQGPGAARNRGAEVSSGDYLLFLDADDGLLPGALSRFRAVIDSHPDIDLIYGGCRSVYRDGSLRERRAPQPSLVKLENFARFVRGKLPCVGGAILIRKRVFDALHYPESIRTSEDYVFFAQAFALYACASFPEPVVSITKHSMSLRHDYDVLNASGMKMIDLLFDPNILPEACFTLRDEVRSRWCLVVSRALYKHGDYRCARQMYEQGIRTYPRHVLLVSYLRKYLKTNAKLVLGKDGRNSRSTATRRN